MLRHDPARLEAEMKYVRDMGLNTIRLEGKLEAAQHDGVVDRVGQHLAHRPLGEHHSIEGHLQTSFHLAEGAVTFRTSVEACPFIGHCQQPTRQHRGEQHRDTQTSQPQRPTSGGDTPAARWVALSVSWAIFPAAFKALTSSPRRSWGIPTTAASATLGWQEIIWSRVGVCAR